MSYSVDQYIVGWLFLWPTRWWRNDGHRHTHTQIHTNTHKYKQIHTHTHKHTHTQRHTHTPHTHTHTHTHTYYSLSALDLTWLFVRWNLPLKKLLIQYQTEPLIPIDSSYRTSLRWHTASNALRKSIYAHVTALRLTGDQWDNVYNTFVVVNFLFKNPRWCFSCDSTVNTYADMLRAIILSISLQKKPAIEAGR